VREGVRLMHPIISLFENKGLIGHDQIAKAITIDWSFSDVDAFFEELYQTTVAEESVLRRAS
jgi:hypothetical protein